MNIKQNRRLPIMIILLLLGVLVLGTIIYSVLGINAPSNKMVFLSEYYSSKDGETAVVCNGELSNVRAIINNQKTYLRLGIVTDELDSHFYYESNSSRLLYTDASGVKACGKDDNYEGYPIFYTKSDASDSTTADEKYYILLDYVASVSNIEITYYQNPGRIFIRSIWGDCEYATCDGTAKIRTSADVSSDIVYEAPSGSKVWVVFKDEDFARVYLGDEYGYSGYVDVDDLENFETVNEPGPNPKKSYNHVSTDKAIALAWHQVFSESGENSIGSLLSGASGLDVVCPTWFTVTDSDGSLSSRVSSSYVKTAKAAGLEVWALVENLNSNTTLDYTSLFGRESSRTKMINKIINDSTSVGVSGINLDFEGLPTSAGKSYVQFVRELALACQAHGLKLSVDCYVPSAWTEHYHRRDLAEACDYFIIMSYDEHYDGSEPGSSASLPFIKKSIANTIAEGVPEEKIINAVPFYSRLWVGNDSDCSSSTIKMSDMRTFMSEHTDDMEWDDELGQYTIDTTVDGERTRLWVEDTRSMQKKLALMGEYNLAGVACWKLGLETSDVWTNISLYKESN